MREGEAKRQIQREMGGQRDGKRHRGGQKKTHMNRENQRERESGGDQGKEIPRETQCTVNKSVLILYEIFSLKLKKISFQLIANTQAPCCHVLYKDSFTKVPTFSRGLTPSELQPQSLFLSFISLTISNQVFDVSFLFEQKLCCQVDEQNSFVCVYMYVCVSHQHYQHHHQSTLIQALSPPLVLYSSIVSPSVHVSLSL